MAQNTITGTYVNSIFSFIKIICNVYIYTSNVTQFLCIVSSFKFHNYLCVWMYVYRRLSVY